MIEKYDLCVIGGGPSGYAAAMRAVDFDKTVLLVERDRIGGAGIYDGALSSKTFWEISKEFASFCKKMRHYGLSEPNVNFHNVLQEVNDAVFERSDQLNEHLRKIIQQRPEHFSYLKGNASLLNKSEIEVKTDFGCQKIFAENIIIATGSRPRKIDTIPFDEEVIMTSDGISSLKEFPESLVILGAGVIGCEFATIFSNFGKTNVHLISKDERILPFEDEDMALAIEKNLEANGVLIHRLSKLDKMGIIEGQVEYVIEHPDREKETFLLLAKGFQPKQIAYHIDTAPKTVMVHRTNIYKKLNVTSQFGLLRIALEIGYLDVYDVINDDALIKTI